MGFLWALFIFGLGAAVGSFLNVLIDRIPIGESILTPPSHCDSCKRRLLWSELIPLVSYGMQKGRCRKCRARISTRVFVVELISGILFVALLFSVQPLASSSQLFEFLITVSLLSGFIAIFVIDAEHGIIPDSILLFMLILILIFHLMTHPTSLLLYGVSGLASLVFFWGIFAVTRGRGMGLGDVKFSFVIGFLLGFPLSILAFYIAFLTGALVSLILVAGGKKKLRGGTVAFGPFLSLGATVAIFFGQHIARIALPFL